MKLKENYKETASSDLYYDFFDGGYLEPEEFLDDPHDIVKVHEARRLLQEYFRLLEDVVDEI